MPFEFVADPTPGTNQRRIGNSIKEGLAKEIVPEVLIWAKFIIPGLLMFPGRQLLPRPLKVLDDTDSHYTGAFELPRDLAKKFVEEHCVAWVPMLGAPTERKDIDTKFGEVTSGNPKEALPNVLLSGNPDAAKRNFFNLKYETKQYSVHKCCMLAGKVWDGTGEKPELAVVTLRKNACIEAPMSSGS